MNTHRRAAACLLLPLALALPAIADPASPATHAAAVAKQAASGPALRLPRLDDEQVERFKAAMSAASDAIAAQDPARAAAEYAKASRIHDGNEGLWYNMACALALAGKPDAALEALRDAAAAGWRDASWPTKDSDLASLHALPAFTEWISGLDRASDATLDLGVTASDEKSLETALEAANARLDAVRPVLGSTELMRETRRISQWRVASWDAIASTREGAARADAHVKALESITRKDFWPKSPDLATEVERRANAFVENNGAHASAPVAELMAALAQAQRLTAAAADLEDEAAQQDAADDAEAGLERRLLVLVASTDDGHAVRAALAKLLAMADDPRMERSLYSRLARLVPEPAERRDLVMSEARGSWFRLEGLPAFEAKTLDGQAITPASLKGRVVLLDFWATWCGPCKAELPNIKEAHERFKGDGFEILGISLDKSKDADPTAFVKWCQENGINWPQVFDGKHWEAALAKTFGVRSIPFPLLLDRDGKVVAADEQLRGEELMKSIEAALLM